VNVQGGAEKPPISQAASTETFTKQLNVRQGEADAMVVEMAQWDRLRKRVNDLEKRWSINWLGVGASASVGIAAAALIAVLTLPPATSETKIGSAVKPVLWVVFGTALVVSAALVYLANLAHGERGVLGADICDEMDTIKTAWKQRETESKTNGT
jgi:hypothetical protein